jgi:hypothetical protein
LEADRHPKPTAPGRNRAVCGAFFGRSRRWQEQPQSRFDTIHKRRITMSNAWDATKDAANAAADAAK